MTGEIVVVIRIILYVIAGYLLKAGLPPDLVHLITTDPGTVELISQALAGAIALLVYLWSRFAKRLGWAT